jgi:hypothetical protein
MSPAMHAMKATQYPVSQSLCVATPHTRRAHRPADTPREGDGRSPGHDAGAQHRDADGAQGAEAHR